MFYTVFSTTDTPNMQWQSELLEYSWKKAGQQGALVRLVATDHPERLPQHRFARSVATTPREVNPETGDNYVPYNKPASLLEWLYAERPHGTVLLVDPDCVFRAPVNRNVAPGFPESQAWIGLRVRKPSGRSPFGLGTKYKFLSKHCVDTGTPAQPVMIPTLIHTMDLKRICGRWLELSGYFREGTKSRDGGPMWESEMLAYVAAAAEYGLEHEVVSLGICTNWPPKMAPDAPVIHYCNAVLDEKGETIWSKLTYDPWAKVDASAVPEHDHGRDLIALVNEFARQMSPSRHAEAAIPQRRDDVLESRVGDELMLQQRGTEQGFWLNESGRIIWELCDGTRTIDQIEGELAARFAGSEADVKSDLQSTIDHLCQAGVLKL